MEKIAMGISDLTVSLKRKKKKKIVSTPANWHTRSQRKGKDKKKGAG